MGNRIRFGFVFLAGCAALLAQSSTGPLTGIITDPSQANLPGVAIELTNEDTGVVERTSSNQAGEYTIPLLPPGRYRLSAQGKGFRGYTRRGVVDRKSTRL